MFSTTSTSRSFDVLLWGATGYTGRLVARVLAERYGPPGKTLNYALGGRTLARLQDVAAMMEEVWTSIPGNTEKPKSDTGSRDGSNIKSSVPLVVLESLSNQTAVNEMCGNTLVVIATAGPFSECGEPIVKGCSVSGTDYVDITGEFQWVRDMHQKYDIIAKKTKSRIIPCCGFDYILNDLGVFYVNHFSTNTYNAKVNVVEQICRVKGSTASGGTLRSILGMLEKSSLCDLIRNAKQRGPYEICIASPTDQKIQKENEDQSCLRYSTLAERWTAPNIMARGIKRYIHWSNEVQHYPYGINMIYRISDESPSFFAALSQSAMLSFISFSLFLASRFPCAKKFVPSAGTGPSAESLGQPGKYVEVDTIALFDSPLGASEDKTQKSSSSSSSKNKKPAQQKVEYRIKFKKGEAYLMTAYAVLEAAVCCVKGRKGTVTIPSTFGVLPPSSALGVTLIDRLSGAGFEFSCIQD